METIKPNYKQLKKYFLNPRNTSHKQYEALRAFFVDNLAAQDVASKYGYTIQSFYTLIRNFKNKFFSCEKDLDLFFKTIKLGRKVKDKAGDLANLILTLRKQYISVPDIKSILDTKKYNVSERYIFSVIKNAGFARLPRRDKQRKQETLKEAKEKITAPQSMCLDFDNEEFNTDNVGLLCFIPVINELGIDTIIENSLYPETTSISKLSSILSFLALKLSNIRRYSADNIWCMDRGMGLLAMLNVLPKTGWYSSYSHRVTRKMDLHFMKELHKIWVKRGLLSDTMNLDFTTIPYWGDDEHLENNWSGKRNKTLSSMLAVLAQDPDSGIIDYGATDVRHKNETKVILEFLDFYRENTAQSKKALRYIVFDSKFTTYENLRRLDEDSIKFITIRRRGKKIVEEIEQINKTEWQKIHVMNADSKGRTLRVHDSIMMLKDYGKEIRQIIITGHGKIKPALLISNDFEIKLSDIIRKYSRRWLIEKGISEQIEFFHLNRVSSAIVIKVDFDFTMTMLAHNLYRLFASDLLGYSHQTDQSIFEKFIYNSGYVKIKDEEIVVQLKKKRHLPVLLGMLEKYQNKKIPWLGNKKLRFEGATTS
jgi:predicted DNA-binding protein YlxM (UPF0122 family)